MVWEAKKYPASYGGEKQPYSRSAVVGNLIFLSGVTGTALETGEVVSNHLEDQMVACLDNIRMAVEEAGGSMNNIIKTFMLIKNLEDYSPMRKAELEYYQEYAPHLVEDPPASTFMQVKSLAKPHCLVGIDAIAVISRDKIPGWEVDYFPMRYGGVKQVYPNLPPGRGMFSKFVTVGNLIFCSGSAGRTLETGDVPSNKLEDQMNVALDKVRLAMEEAHSSMNNLIKIVHLVRDLEDIPQMWEVERAYYRNYAPLLIEEPPTSVVIQPQSLARPRYLIELDVMGVVSRDRTGWEVKKYPLYYGVKQPYAKSVTVGNIIFVSAMGGQSPDAGRFRKDNLDDQIVVALDKIRLILEQAGGSMNNIIKTMMYLKNLEDYSRMREIEHQYYEKYAPLLVENPPASTFIQPASLPNPDYLFEVEVVGVLCREDAVMWQHLGSRYLAGLGSI
jgi:2-iminobutanoate/2-iminopropanoate deaminase